MVEIRVEYDESTHIKPFLLPSARPDAFLLGLQPVPLDDVGNPRMNGWHVGGADNSTNDRFVFRFVSSYLYTDASCSQRYDEVLPSAHGRIHGIYSCGRCNGGEETEMTKPSRVVSVCCSRLCVNITRILGYRID